MEWSPGGHLDPGGTLTPGQASGILHRFRYAQP